MNLKSCLILLCIVVIANAQKLSTTTKAVVTEKPGSARLVLKTESLEKNVTSRPEIKPLVLGTERKAVRPSLKATAGSTLSKALKNEKPVSTTVRPRVTSTKPQLRLTSRSTVRPNSTPTRLASTSAIPASVAGRVVSTTARSTVRAEVNAPVTTTVRPVVNGVPVTTTVRPVVNGVPVTTTVRPVVNGVPVTTTLRNTLRAEKTVEQSTKRVKISTRPPVESVARQISSTVKPVSTQSMKKL